MENRKAKAVDTRINRRQFTLLSTCSVLLLGATSCGDDAAADETAALSGDTSGLGKAADGTVEVVSYVIQEWGQTTSREVWALLHNNTGDNAVVSHFSAGDASLRFRDSDQSLPFIIPSDAYAIASFDLGMQDYAPFPETMGPVDFVCNATSLADYVKADNAEYGSSTSAETMASYYLPLEVQEVSASDDLGSVSVTFRNATGKSIRAVNVAIELLWLNDDGTVAGGYYVPMMSAFGVDERFENDQVVEVTTDAEFIANVTSRWIAAAEYTDFESMM